MLLRFSFKNFRSFRDEMVLDLTAAKLTEHADMVVKLGYEKVLPLAGIFGANASGKSNVIAAFDYMQYYVLRSLSFGGESAEKGKKTSYNKPEPFLFDHISREGDSTFEVYYTLPDEKAGKTYNYGFIVNAKGVVEEWLNYRSKSARGAFKPIFYRNTVTGELDLTGIAKTKQENIKVSLEKETLVVSLGAQLKIPKLKTVREWFRNNDVLDFGRPELNFFLSRLLPENFGTDVQVRQNVVKYFASFDSSIVDFKVEEIADEKQGKNYNVEAVHKMIGGEETTTIPLHEESAGTLKMFALYPHLHEVLSRGSLLVVDELNSRLHPLLVRTLLLTFLNPKLNPKHAQLVFTTLDTWNMGNGILRRDEVWFTQKDEQGLSNLYSLADIKDETNKKIRKDESYEKNYLLGKYGAIPELKSFLVAEDKNGEK